MAHNSTWFSDDEPRRPATQQQRSAVEARSSSCTGSASDSTSASSPSTARLRSRQRMPQLRRWLRTPVIVLLASKACERSRSIIIISSSKSRTSTRSVVTSIPTFSTREHRRSMPACCCCQCPARSRKQHAMLSLLCASISTVQIRNVPFEFGDLERTPSPRGLYMYITPAYQPTGLFRPCPWLRSTFTSEME